MANQVEQLIKSNQSARTQGTGYVVGQYLPLDQIRMDGGTQARAGLDNQTLAEYAESWLTLSHRQNGFLEMPLIIVYHDGTDYWLADGFHRVVAYRQFLDAGSASASPQAIRAEVRMGTKRDAVLYACGANATHGLKRTQADKRRAIETMLGDNEWRQWSDSEIARRCNVDHKTVASVRADLYPGNSQDSRTVERGGTTYQQKSPTSRLGPGQPPPDPWPDAPEGWRWNRRGAPAHLIAPNGWRTADYNYPERALAEAQPYLLTLSPFWQAIDAHHPTAHLWTRERPDLLRSACGMTTQNRLPSGSTEAGHCSSCVRATWPQNQAAAAEEPNIPELAPITVQTNQGPREIVPTRTNGVLAWHTSLTTGGRYAITHIPSGRRIAQFMYEGRVNTAFDQLASLDWAAVAPDGGMQPPMAIQVARVLCQFDDVDQYAFRQKRLAELEAEIAAAPEVEIEPMDMDDAAMQAAIRTNAQALGLELTWDDDDRVTLFWAGEDLDTIEPMGYGRALKWLATEAVELAAHRAELAAAAPRRLTRGAHAQAMTLLNTIRTALITDHIDVAETQARQLLAIIETGEAED